MPASSRIEEPSAVTKASRCSRRTMSIETRLDPPNAVVDGLPDVGVSVTEGPASDAGRKRDRSDHLRRSTWLACPSVRECPPTSTDEWPERRAPACCRQKLHARPFASTHTLAAGERAHAFVGLARIGTSLPDIRATLHGGSERFHAVGEAGQTPASLLLGPDRCSPVGLSAGRKRLRRPLVAALHRHARLAVEVPDHAYPEAQP